MVEFTLAFFFLGFIIGHLHELFGHGHSTLYPTNTNPIHTKYIQSTEIEHEL